MLLTSLQILQYFLCQSSDIPPNMKKSIEPHQWQLHGCYIPPISGCTLITWKSPLNPIGDPYTGGNIDPVAKHLILTPAKPMTLVFQAPSNVLTYLPLQPFASWRISYCYSVPQHLSLSPVSSSVSVSATTESSLLRPLDHLLTNCLCFFICLCSMM
jgi:hypothetical protein